MLIPKIPIYITIFLLKILIYASPKSPIYNYLSSKNTYICFPQISHAYPPNFQYITIFLLKILIYASPKFPMLIPQISNI